MNDLGVDYLVSEWLDMIDVSESTRNRYKGSLLAWFAYLARKKINNKSPTRAQARNFRDELVITKNCTTVNFYLSAIRQFYKYLNENNLYRNYIYQIKDLKRNNDISKEPLTDNQIFQLLNVIDKKSIKGVRDYAIVNLMLMTGLRRVEVKRLRDSDIIIERSQLKIRRKGSNSYITFGINDDVLIPIIEYINFRNKYTPHIKFEYLFISLSRNSLGKGLSVEAISRIVKKVLKQIGLDGKEYTAHSLRHTSASIALKGGAELYEISAMLGHSNLKTTSIYLEALQRHTVQNNPAISIISKRIKEKALINSTGQ